MLSGSRLRPSAKPVRLRRPPPWPAAIAWQPSRGGTSMCRRKSRAAKHSCRPEGHPGECDRAADGGQNRTGNQQAFVDMHAVRLNLIIGCHLFTVASGALARQQEARLARMA